MGVGRSSPYEQFGLGVMPYIPLASGLLSGKYTRGKKPPNGTRLAADDDYYRSLLSEANFDKAEALEAWAAERGHSLLELALFWLASRTVVSTVIAGATKARQIKANVAAINGWTLDVDDMAAVDDVLKGA